MGTTWTRFRLRLDASLLTITAGRVFWISPPSEGSKSTHQTSPRSIGPVPCYIADDAFRPFVGGSLAFLVACHFAVGRPNVLRHHMRAGELLDELADPPAADDIMEALVDFVADHYCEFAVHIVYTYCTRITAGIAIL